MYSASKGKGNEAETQRNEMTKCESIGEASESLAEIRENSEQSKKSSMTKECRISSYKRSI